MRYLFRCAFAGLSFLSIAILLTGCISNAPPPRTADTANYAIISEKNTRVGKMITSGLKLQPTYDINIQSIDGVKLPSSLKSAHLISPGKHSLDVICVEFDPDMDPDDTYTPTFNRILQFTAQANKSYQLEYDFPSKSHYKYYDNPCDYVEIKMTS